MTTKNEYEAPQPDIVIMLREAIPDDLRAIGGLPTGIQNKKKEERLPYEEERPALDLAHVFERADEIAKTSIRGRPKKGAAYQPKKGVMLRLDPAVLDWLSSKGHLGTTANAYLFALMEAEQAKPDRGAELSR